MPGYRLSCDIGGTFTDVTVYEQATGRVHYAKVPTDTVDPAEGALSGISRALAEVGIDSEDLDTIVHGTTLVSNAVIERKGARTALVTTNGFRDTLEIRREIRYDTYDPYAEFPEPLVPRALRFEVGGRLWRDGIELEPIDMDEVKEVAQAISAAGVESVAVCLLHAFSNAVHERTVGEILAQHLPGIDITTSHEIVRKPGEFERTSTTVINAYVTPLVRRYIANLSDGLAESGFSGEVHYMLSSGGIGTTDAAVATPVQLLESGAAGGATMAGWISAVHKRPNVLGYDMGGTTAKMSMVISGKLQKMSSFEAARVSRFRRGSGFPVMVPAADLIEIGAGGGSIASVNELGLLQVGPESAGASPGPVCYQKGGTEPTCTDASVVLGYYNSSRFTRDISLDAELARVAIERKIGRRLQVEVEQAAWGIHNVVTENMANAVKMYLMEKGRQAGEFTLSVSGGAGPTYACDLADRLGVEEILIPRLAGVASALGFLAAPFSFDFTRSVRKVLNTESARVLSSVFDESIAESKLKLAPIAGADTITIQRFVEMRYTGQSAEDLEVEVPTGVGVTQSLLRTLFDAKYQSLFGENYAELDVELLDCRVVASVGGAKEFRPVFEEQESEESVTEVRRLAYSPSVGGKVYHPVYSVRGLSQARTVAGPSIIEVAGSTLLVREGWTASMVDDGTILLRRSHAVAVGLDALEGATDVEV